MITAEIKDVIQDTERGSIIVQTEYKNDGVFVQLGQTRYLETSGTEAEIIQKAKDDIAQHCENLIKRLPANQTYLVEQKLIQQKALTEPIITNIKPSLIGHTDSKKEVVEEFKGVEIKVTDDSKNTVTEKVI